MKKLKVVGKIVDGKFQKKGDDISIDDRPISISCKSTGSGLYKIVVYMNGSTVILNKIVDEDDWFRKGIQNKIKDLVSAIESIVE